MDNPEEKTGIKKYLTPRNIIIASVTPLVLLPVVFGGIYLYKKFKK